MKKMKRVVVIYFDDDWAARRPIKSDPVLRRFYEDWHTRGLSLGVAMFRASIQWYDARRHYFTKGWAYRAGRWRKIAKPIKPDLVFDILGSQHDYQYFELKKQMARRFKIYNDPAFRTLLDNKLNQYVVLREFMPHSAVVNNPADWRAVRGQFRGRVAAKPLYGKGGVGIKFFDSRRTVPRGPYPMLIQQFISSHGGIPGFSRRKVLADLRLVYIDHQLMFAMSREAKPGSLFTNFHQGAKAVRVPLNKVPAVVKRQAGKIIKILKIFPAANYSLDFLFADTGRPYLIEMNTTPGADLLDIIGDAKLRRRYFAALVLNHL